MENIDTGLVTIGVMAVSAVIAVDGCLRGSLFVVVGDVPYGIEHAYVGFGEFDASACHHPACYVKEFWHGYIDVA